MTDTFFVRVGILGYFDADLSVEMMAESRSGGRI